jgi:hypothetical protein
MTVMVKYGRPVSSNIKCTDIEATRKREGTEISDG